MGGALTSLNSFLLPTMIPLLSKAPPSLARLLPDELRARLGTIADDSCCGKAGGGDVNNTQATGRTTERKNAGNQSADSLQAPMNLMRHHFERGGLGRGKLRRRAGRRQVVAQRGSAAETHAAAAGGVLRA